MLGLLYSVRACFWKKVKGRITRSELHEYEDDGTMYEPKIEYEYSFNGKKYNNDYIAYAVGSTNRKSSAKYYLGFYGKGWDVIVYVNPSKPTKSVLAPGIRYQNLVLLFIFIFAIYFWVPVGWAMWPYLFAL